MWPRLAAGNRRLGPQAPARSIPARPGQRLAHRPAISARALQPECCCQFGIMQPWPYPLQPALAQVIRPTAEDATLLKQRPTRIWNCNAGKTFIAREGESSSLTAEQFCSLMMALQLAPVL